MHIDSEADQKYQLESGILFSSSAANARDGSGSSEMDDSIVFCDHFFIKHFQSSTHGKKLTLEAGEGQKSPELVFHECREAN